MSNALLTQCWPLQMPPTAKAVLVAMADVAEDSGYCWPSLANLCERTCFGKTAVIEAVKWLESNGYLRADRSNRYRTTYVLTPGTGAAPALVREADKCGRRTTPADGGLVRLPENEVRQPENEVRQPDTTHQDPSVPINKAPIKKRASAPALDPVVADLLKDAEPAVVADWLALRKAKRAPVTATVAQHALAEAAKAGMTITAFLRVWCARGSQGLEASWLKPHERAQAPPGRHSAAADLRGKQYGSTDESAIPAHLRPRDLDDAAA